MGRYERRWNVSENAFPLEMRRNDMIDFEEEIERFKPSLDVEEVEDAIVKSDLTDMTDIMMELIKERDEK